MKITKSSKDGILFATTKAAANEGCDRCPCCGEAKTWEQYMREGVYHKGIMSGAINKTWIGEYST